MHLQYSTTPLLQHVNNQFLENRAIVPLHLLLMMKISGNMIDHQMTSFDVLLPVSKNSTVNCNSANCSTNSSLPSPGINNEATLATFIVMTIVAFLLPTLGGALSDTKLRVLRVLWLCAITELCCSIVLTVLDSLSIIRMLPPNALTNAAPIRAFMGFGDTMFLYTTMQFATHRNSRLFIISLYFIARGLGEAFGQLSGAVRYFFNQNVSFIGIIFTCCSLICMAFLSHNRTAHYQVFKPPRYFEPLFGGRILKRFYLIAAGCIPFFACVKLCEYELYLTQFRYLVNYTATENVIASYTGLITFQVATIPFCALMAFAAWRGSVTKWLGLEYRINAGISIMLVTKIPLLIMNLTVKTGSFSSTTAWIICTVFSFCDGIGNTVATVALHELMCCIADKNLKATFIGIFYTVWGFADLLNCLVALVLNYVPVQNTWSPCTCIIIIIILLIISIIYWRKISLPKSRGLLENHEEETTQSLLC